MLDQTRGVRLAVTVKGYPRLSETFIAQELLELERRGLQLEIWSLRHPTDKAVHPMHEQIAARRVYLPEYLYQEPLRVLRGLRAGLRRPGMRALLTLFLRDLVRDPTPNRLRRLGQALVMAHEMDPGLRHIHAHYLHTPLSVVRYAALLSGRSFSVSAHAKDIWTIPDWELREKLADVRFAVTCTREGAERLRTLAPGPETVTLVYHGLDLERFPQAPSARPLRDGTEPSDPVELVSVGRCVPKKGFPVLIEALAALPRETAWRLTHIGSGPLLKGLRQQAEAAGLADRIRFLGSRPQGDVIAALRTADLFVLPCREGSDGDRDGLPNVILEAATQALPIVSTRFAGVPEFVREESEGLLVPPDDAAALAQALAVLIADPGRRHRLGQGALRRIREDFSFAAGIDAIEQRLRACLAEA